jgi:hypothetical protein
MAVKGTIIAHIKCVVEIHVGNWGGGNTDLEKLAEQVKREGKNKLQRLLSGKALEEPQGGKIIGEPQVIFILLEEQT